LTKALGVCDKIIPGASANEAQKKESYYAREIT
jgi:hypothetical protein